MFIRARQGEFASLGVGKLLGTEQGRHLVEFFDAPFASTRVEAFEPAALEEVVLPEQTRVYCFDRVRGVWGIGRLLDDHREAQLVRFPNGKTATLEVADVFVRWDLPIVDPTPFLAAQITESPRFSEARRRFVASLLRQRAASFGMSGLISSSIELEPHQIEVVRRVLQDPVQRFLLADEVGLGKTIEAGVLIRQCAIETAWVERIVVLVPEALVAQWRQELTQKFALATALDKTLFVVSFSEPNIAHHLSRAAMLVVDEAHHLSLPVNSGLYGLVASMAPAIERLLLLSATPVLHNERSFLEMLHLIDPATYRFEDEAAFRRRIEARAELGDILALLNPQSALYLDSALDRLGALFPENTSLQEDVALLRAVIETMPDEDTPELRDAIMRLKAHLSEVYRLDRRILRNRRSKVGGLTPGRAGVLIADFSCPSTARVVQSIEAWRFAAVDAPETMGEVGLALVERSLAPSLEPTPGGISSLSATIEGGEVLEARLEALVGALQREKLDHEQWVVFCSAPSVADAVAAHLEELDEWPVLRHVVSDGAWRAFSEGGTQGAVLVCDNRAEEGLNLQGAQRWIVHFDLPLNPNRIEQRMGRLDRYGSGEAVRSLVLRCLDNPYEAAWIEYLDTALRVFDRSVASLQYLIDQTMRRLSRDLLTEGVRALSDLAQNEAGVAGEVERELAAIERQEELDALGNADPEPYDALFDAEAAWSTMAGDCSAWIEGVLQFNRAHLERGADELNAIFRYVYARGTRHTLVPLKTFHDAAAASLQLDPSEGRRVQTYPCAYRRLTALSRKGRAHGTRPLRFGDAFVDGIASLTARDDRGRQMAMWRHVAGGFEPLGKGDVHFRFDFIIESDLTEIEAKLREQDAFSSVSRAAMRRRGDMALGPAFETVWLDSELREVSDGLRKELLEAPYRGEAAAQGGRDFNLNAERWRALSSFGLPELSYWKDLCARARASAEACVRSRAELIEACARAAQRTDEADAGRLALLRARATRAGAAAHDARTFREEVALSRALIDGVRLPSMRVESASAVFLSADMGIANAMARA